MLCHGFPTGIASAAATAASFPQLADRIAIDMGWMVALVQLPGVGQSEGDFSLAGWLDDVHAAIDHLQTVDRVRSVWLAGFGTGGALCICAGALRPEVRGGRRARRARRLRRLGRPPSPHPRARP